MPDAQNGSDTWKFVPEHEMLKECISMLRPPEEQGFEEVEYLAVTIFALMILLNAFES